MPTFTMLSDQVLVRRADAVEKIGSLHVPSHSRDVPLIGTVVAVGPGRTTGDRVTPVCVAAGDTVVFGRYAGTEIMLDGVQHLVLRDAELLGVISDGA